MNIIHFTPHARTFTQFRFELIKNLELSGNTNILISTAEQPHTDNLVKEGFSVISEDFSTSIDKRIILSIFKLRMYIKKIDSSVVFLHQPMALLIGVLSTIGLNVRLVYFTGGLKTNDSMSFFSKFIHRSVEFSLLNKCALVLSVNQEDCEFLSGKVKAKVRYVGPRGGCGIDTGKFKFSQSEGDSCRKKLNVNSDQIVLGMVGRIEREKGIFVVLEEFVRIAKYNSMVTFVLIGAGSSSLELESFISFQPEEIQNRIKYLGRKEDVFKWYSCIDIFILASKREGMPTSLLEAMSTSCLVVSTNVRGAREVVIHNYNGFIYNGIDKLCQSLNKIVDNFEKYKYIYMNARDTISTRYSIDYCFPKTKQILVDEIAIKNNPTS
jgi:glycosyltransferase involved in cell wall biosynthesis